MIKGRGGAMYHGEDFDALRPEDAHPDRPVETGVAPRAKFPIPVEVSPVSLHLVERELLRLGAVDMALRPAGGKDGPVISESGNFILDVRFREIYQSLETEIKNITGVIESGLFMGYPVELVVAGT